MKISAVAEADGRGSVHQNAIALLAKVHKLYRFHPGDHYAKGKGGKKLDDFLIDKSAGKGRRKRRSKR